MAYIYVTQNRFCADDSTALRIRTFCQILHELDKEVIVISLDENTNHIVHDFKGIKYVTLRNPSNSFVSRLMNLVLHRPRLRKSINRLMEDYKIEGVFFYDLPPLSTVFLKNYARNQNIKIFHDSVEWYSAVQFKWGKIALPYLLKNILNSYLIDQQVRVFAISKYLHSYFKSKEISATRIPIVMDTQNIVWEKKKNSDKLVLMYAGTPGKKDYLNEIIVGLSELSESDLARIELNIFGVTESQLIKDCDVSVQTLEICGKSLVAHGRVKRTSVMEHLQRSDFTILLRSAKLRYAKAGFPTKVVESLATATPVICNITSDLGDYLIDGENALIVKDCSSIELRKTLKKALSLSREEKQRLSSNARKTAENYFDYRTYIEQFNSFILSNENGDR